MTDIYLYGVFAAIAALHAYLEKHHSSVEHFHMHWLVFFLHPTVLVSLKDWAIHILVYSKYALLAH